MADMENSMQKTANQLEQLRNKTDVSEDEIVLSDILFVIWKWKYFIIGGTVVCAIAAIVFSLTMSKIYRMEMIIRPGILTFDEDGNARYIDTPVNIKALIDTGAFEKKILDNLIESGRSNIPKGLKFTVTLPNNSNTLKINYESSQIEQGIESLELLGKFLMMEYSSVIEYFRYEIDSVLNIRKGEIQQISSIKRSNEIKINNIKKRIHELESDIVSINENTAHLTKERNKFLSKGKDESNILSVILYSNTIQQNLQLSNSYLDEVKNLMVEKETELQKISMLENQLQRQLTEIDKLKFKKTNTQNIQILQKPYSSPYPIKPKKRLIVILATTIGIFITVILAVFIDNVLKIKSRRPSQKTN
jgi:LPS O-antigen subunit length determinant protein (WzzB/FepE family)